jgi:hypothetical protein
METHFMSLLTNSSCADVASRGSLEPVVSDLNGCVLNFIHLSATCVAEVKGVSS